MFNKRLFRARLVERGVTLKDTASILGISEGTLYRKVNGVSDFTRNEIQLLKKSLHLTVTDVEAIFFAQELA